MIDYGSSYIQQNLITLIAKALYLWTITTVAVMIIVIAILFIRNYVRVLKRVLKNKY